MDNGLTFILIPAPEESAPENLEWQQSRLRSLPVRPASGGLPFRVHAPGGVYGTRAGVGPVAGPDLQSLLSFAGKALPTVGTALVAWLGGRYGRKVRVKVGDLEIEANTSHEVKDLLLKVEEMQKRQRSASGPKAASE